jgi:large subunit ribosomal protein L11
MDFCKEFNARSQGLIVGTPCPTAIKINPDKTFKFRIKTPTVSYFLKKAAGVEKGTSGKGIKGKKAVVGKVGLKTVYEIAKVKQMDEHMKDEPLYGIAAKVVASAKSLGIEVVY